MRDDFTEATKLLLAKRVGFRCSNPECRKPTSGPQADAEMAVNIGVAAHITAASEGGPRYEPSLIAEARRHPNNGIWLCQNCAKLVDNDPQRYPVEILLQWKRRAEQDALTEIERRVSPSHVATAPIVSTPFNLPADVPDFAGRERELRKVRDRLSQSRGTAISLVAGMGGIGKTALALRVAHQLAAEGRFSDAQLYIDLKGTDAQPLSPATALIFLLTALVGPHSQWPDDLDGLAARWRAAIHGKDAIVILDNAAGAEQVRPLLPGCPTCAVLVTSRRRFALPGVTPLDLERLKPEEARQLLKGLAPRLEDRDADEIGQLCGGLPLALRIAGQYVAINDDVTPSDYVARLADERTRLVHLHDANDPELDVAASLSLSVDQLDKETRRAWALLALFPAPFDAAAAAALWGSIVGGGSVLAVFPEDIDPEERFWLLQNLMSQTSVALLDEERTLSRLQLLRNRSLIVYDADNGRYDQHDLLRLAAEREKQALSILGTEAESLGSIDDAQERIARYYLARMRELIEGQRYAALDPDWPHIQAALEYATGGHDTVTNRLAMDLVWIVEDYLDARGLHAERIKWLEKGISCARQGSRLEMQAEFLSLLGNLYRSRGQAGRAVECYEQALDRIAEYRDESAISPMQLRPVRSMEGVYLGNLGLAYHQLGEAYEAIELTKRALAASRETHDRSNECTWLGNLGLIYGTVGRIPEAIEYHQQALAISREIGDRRREAVTLGSLGSGHLFLDDTESAMECFEQALSIACEIGDRSHEGDYLAGLGKVSVRLGEHQRAVELFERALALQMEIGDPVGEAKVHSGLGDAHYASGDYQRAISHYEKALSIAQQFGDRINMGVFWSNLGLAYSGVDQIQKGIECYEQALSIHRDLHNLPREIVELLNLGHAYYQLGDMDLAAQYYRQAVTISWEIEDLVQRRVALNHLGGVYWALGERGQAIGCYEAAIAAHRQVGDRSSEAGDLHNLGRLLVELYDGESAAEYLAESLALYREIGDPYGEGNNLLDLGLAYQMLGEVVQASECHQQALSISRIIGHEALEVSCLVNLGMLARQQGDETLARQLWNQALVVCQSLQDPTTTELLSHLLENLHE